MNERTDGSMGLRAKVASMNAEIRAIEDETWREGMSVMDTESTGTHGETLFRFDRETKNAVRYEEVVEPGKEPGIRTIYMKKWAMPKDRKWPSYLYVHLRFED